jgi:hypothetical protein
MVMIPEPSWSDSVFVLESDDRFYKIISSGDILFESAPGTVAVITFFVIRRQRGVFDIYIVHKTFEKSGEVLKSVQSKENIGQQQIDAEVTKIRDVFGLGVTVKTGYQINWNELDLSGVADRDEQIRRIKAWGGLRVYRQEGKRR